MSQRFVVPPFLVLTCTTLLFWLSGPVQATTFTDPVFGWQLQLPDGYTIEAMGDTGGSISGAPAKAWMLNKDPMNYVAYQVEDADLRNSIRYEEFKKKTFEAISASMLHTAQQAGAQQGSTSQQIMVAGQMFDSLLWVLQAPGRPELRSMTLVGSMVDKAVTIGISCTGELCAPVFAAIDNSSFSNPTGAGKVKPLAPPPPAAASEPVWNFTIPAGWKRTVSNAPEDKLTLEKGEGNQLNYALMEGDYQGLDNAAVQQLKAEVFKEAVGQFQQIAHENGLLFHSEEEVLNLGQYPFQSLAMGLLDPQSQEPAMVAGQLLAIVKNRLVLIMVTCVDEPSCNEIQQAIESSSFL